MSTGTSFVDIHRKRLLGTTDFSTRLLDHLRTLVQESYERSYRTGVIYDSALTLSGAAADAFDVGGTSLATDGLGHLLDIASFGFQSSVKFENTLSQDYQVGLAYTEVPDGVQINTGTGLPEYIGTKEAIGDSADPDAVTDNGGTITFQIDSVCESGVTHAGRTARVYLKTPAKNAITEALAIEELTVAYTAGQNRITTAGTLGQDTVSTDPADYTVVLLGPTVKRNTTIKATDGYAYIGTITGAGAGSIPSSFDITEQEVMTGSLSQLSHITRVASNDRLKIDVKAITGESGEDQIRVTDSTGAVKFKVDEGGNVTIEGNLEVTGTTTQNDIVIVNSSETITDNLTAGDNDASDSHVIKGEWKHTNTAGTANYFTVDGDTGRVGIGALYDSTWGLNIGGTARVLDTLRIEAAGPTLQFRETDVAVNAGGLWRVFVAGGNLAFRENTAAGGDFSTEKTWGYFDRTNDYFVLNTTLIPFGNDTYDLGRSADQWKDLYIDGTAYVDALSLSTAASEGVVTDLYPSADGTLDLGGVGREWQDLYVDGTAYVDTLSMDTTAGLGCATDFNPTTDNALDLGSPSRQWANVYTVNLNVGSDINPAADLTYDLGGSALRWLNLYVRNIDGGPAVSDYVQVNSLFKIVHDQCALWLRESDVAVTAGGLWRFAMSSGDWSLQENTAAGGDFSATKSWIFADQSSDTLLIGSHLKPSSTGYDLGGGNEWRAFYLSDNAGHGVVGNLVPTTNGTVDLGNSSYRWDALYGNTIDLNYSNDSDWVPAILINRHSVTDTNARLRIASYYVDTDATMGDNFGGAINYYTGTTRVAQFEWLRKGADDQVYLRWLLRDASDVDTVQLRLRYSGIMDTRTIFPLVDGTYDLGSSSYRWANVYSANVWAFSSIPRVYFRETDVTYTNGGLWRLQLNSGQLYLQENTAAAGDFTSSQNWWYTERATSEFRFYAHLVPQNDNQYDLGNATREWRNLYVDGTAYIDTLSLSTAGSEGVSSHLYPSADKTYNLGTSGRYWAQLACETMLLQYTNDTVTSTAVNWYRQTETITDQALTMASFIASSDLAITDGFGGVWKFWLNSTAGLFNVGTFTWQRSGASDQVTMTWSLRDGADAITSVLGIQYNGFVRTRHIVPYVNGASDLGTSTNRWRHLYVEGNIHIDDDLNFLIQRNGSNPYFKMDSGDDAFWFSRASDRFYFRINGDDTVFRIDATQGEINANFVPYQDTTHDLGAVGKNWDYVYARNVVSDDWLVLDSGSNITYVEDYRVVPVGAVISGQNLFMAGTQGGWNTSVQNGDGRLNLTWNAYREGSDWRYWDGNGVDSDGATRCLITTSGAALIWEYYFTDARGASDGAVITWDTDPALRLASGGLTTKHISPVDNDTYDLGNASYVWRAVYMGSLLMTGTAGTFARNTLYPGNVGDANGFTLLLQGGGATYIGGGEGAQAVWTGLGDIAENLHLCADNAISFWTGTNTYAASDRKIHIDSTGLVYIANGGAPTSGGAAKLNIGATGTAGTTDLRGSHLTAYESTALSTTVDTRRRLFAVGGNSDTNESWLTISQYRIASGSGWTNAGFRIGHEVSDSADVGGYIQFGVNNFEIKGDMVPATTGAWDLGSSSLKWDYAYLDHLSVANGAGEGVVSHLYPSANDTWELGTTSYRWKHLYTTFINATLESTTLTAPCAVFTRDPDTVGNNLFPVIRLNNAPSSAAATTGSGGYIDMQTEGTSCARIFWKYATANRTCNLAFALDNGSVFADRLLLTYDGYAEFQCHVIPESLNTFDLGTAGAYWQDFYTQNVYYKGTHTTFDDQDDLALIDAYTPLESETIEVEKAGVKREVQTTRAALPWPMLGPKDPDGEAFIHGADAITFLVGAIKQLHGKHKSKVVELEAKIDALAAKLEALTA